MAKVGKPPPPGIFKLDDRILCNILGKVSTKDRVNLATSCKTLYNQIQPILDGIKTHEKPIVFNVPGEESSCMRIRYVDRVSDDTFEVCYQTLLSKHMHTYEIEKYYARYLIDYHQCTVTQTAIGPKLMFPYFDSVNNGNAYVWATGPTSLVIAVKNPDLSFKKRSLEVPEKFMPLKYTTMVSINNPITTRVYCRIAVSVDGNTLVFFRVPTEGDQFVISTWSPTSGFSVLDNINLAHEMVQMIHNGTWDNNIMALRYELSPNNEYIALSLALTDNKNGIHGIWHIPSKTRVFFTSARNIDSSIIEYMKDNKISEDVEITPNTGLGPFGCDRRYLHFSPNSKYIGFIGFIIELNKSSKVNIVLYYDGIRKGNHFTTNVAFSPDSTHVVISKTKGDSGDKGNKEDTKLIRLQNPQKDVWTYGETSCRGYMTWLYPFSPTGKFIADYRNQKFYIHPFIFVQGTKDVKLDIVKEFTKPKKIVPKIYFSQFDEFILHRKCAILYTGTQICIFPFSPLFPLE